MVRPEIMVENSPERAPIFTSASLVGCLLELRYAKLPPRVAQKAASVILLTALAINQAGCIAGPSLVDLPTTPTPPSPTRVNDLPTGAPELTPATPIVLQTPTPVITITPTPLPTRPVEATPSPVSIGGPGWEKLGEIFPGLSENTLKADPVKGNFLMTAFSSLKEEQIVELSKPEYKGTSIQWLKDKDGSRAVVKFNTTGDPRFLFWEVIPNKPEEGMHSAVVYPLTEKSGLLANQQVVTGIAVNTAGEIKLLSGKNTVGETNLMVDFDGKGAKEAKIAFTQILISDDGIKYVQVRLLGPKSETITFFASLVELPVNPTITPTPPPFDAEWQLTPNGNLLNLSGWEKSSQTLNASVKLINGQLTTESQKGFFTTVNNEATFNIQGPFEIKTQFVGQGRAYQLSFYGRFSQGEWWQGVRRFDIGYDAGNSSVLFYDGKSDKPHVYSLLKIPSGGIKIIFDQKGSSVQILDAETNKPLTKNGDLITLPSELFPDGKIIVGTNVGPDSKLTVSGLQLVSAPDKIKHAPPPTSVPATPVPKEWPADQPLPLTNQVEFNNVVASYTTLWDGKGLNGVPLINPIDLSNRGGERAIFLPGIQIGSVVKQFDPSTGYLDTITGLKFYGGNIQKIETLGMFGGQPWMRLQLRLPDGRLATVDLKLKDNSLVVFDKFLPTGACGMYLSPSNTISPRTFQPNDYVGISGDVVKTLMDSSLNNPYIRTSELILVIKEFNCFK